MLSDKWYFWKQIVCFHISVSPFFTVSFLAIRTMMIKNIMMSRLIKSVLCIFFTVFISQYLILYRRETLKQCSVNGLISEQFITSSARFSQIMLQFMFIKLYIYNPYTCRIKDGYDHAVKVEEKRPWPISLPWYRTLLELLENYKVCPTFKT